MQVDEKKAWDPQSIPTYWINHASRQIVRLFEARLRPLQIGWAYIPVIFALEKTSAGGLSQKELTHRVKIEQPTMAALLNRMERNCVIKRSNNPHDRRESLITLTSAARKKIPAIKQKLVDGAEHATQNLSDVEKQMLISCLKRVVENLMSAG